MSSLVNVNLQVALHKMHQCLAIVELQRIIFHKIYLQDEGLVTLARLAHTCRAFNSVALDIIWHTLDSFMPLIKCLPQDLWKIDHVDNRMVFQRSMSFKDWEIFFRYSTRIWCLSQLSLDHCTSLGDDVIFALSNPPTHGPLIPNLMVLSWDKPDKKHASLLRLLLTPSLRYLSLSSCLLRCPEVSILTSIGTMCPSLLNLSISPCEPFTDSLDAQGQKILSEVLLHLHSLISLSCPTLEETAIVHLSRLPLHNLSLGLQRDFQFEKVRLHMVPPAFASIHSLTVHANSLPTLALLLESIRFKPTMVSFDVVHTPTTDALHSFLLTLAGACDSEQLSKISLNAGGEQLPGPVTLSTLQPLFAFPNISLFKFDVLCDVALDDDAIKTLAEHWPKMETLSINSQSGWGVPLRTTYRGLIALLVSCPKLCSLKLEVDFSDIDVPHAEMAGTRPGGGVVNHACSDADFLVSTIVHPITIAAFLSDVCPNLKSVRSAIYSERWGKVVELLPAFSAVRKQCMAWAEKEVKERSIEGA